MCRSNIFEAIVSAVVAETEISKEQICSHSKLVDVVEARRIACQYLCRAGFFPAQIGRLMGQSRQDVNFLLKPCKNPSKIALIYCKHLDKTLAEYLLTSPDA